jgi:hypothetical protein
MWKGLLFRQSTSADIEYLGSKRETEFDETQSPYTPPLAESQLVMDLRDAVHELNASVIRLHHLIAR